jgi:membrane protein implicated in regulation of membrane protease activity
VRHLPFAVALAPAAVSLIAALAGAPWWMAVIAFLWLLCALVVVLVQLVFPQESADRLAWWRDRRRYRQ